MTEEVVCLVCGSSMKYDKKSRYFVCEHCGQGLSKQDYIEMMNDD